MNRIGIGFLAVLTLYTPLPAAAAAPDRHDAKRAQYETALAEARALQRQADEIHREVSALRPTSTWEIAGALALVLVALVAITRLRKPGYHAEITDSMGSTGGYTSAATATTPPANPPGLPPRIPSIRTKRDKLSLWWKKMRWLKLPMGLALIVTLALLGWRWMRPTNGKDITSVSVPVRATITVTEEPEWLMLVSSHDGARQTPATGTLRQTDNTLGGFFTAQNGKTAVFRARQVGKRTWRGGWEENGVERGGSFILTGNIEEGLFAGSWKQPDSPDERDRKGGALKVIKR